MSLPEGDTRETLFSRLLNDTADDKHHSLSSVLLRAKVVAAQLASNSFRNWIAKESGGYEAVEDVPSYRVIFPVVLGDFWGAYGAKTVDVPVTLDQCPEEMRDFIYTFPLPHNCAELEGLLESDSETQHRHFDARIVGLVRQCSRARVDGQSLQGLQAVFTKSQVRGVIHAIRSRLLDFLLELQTTFPSLATTTSIGTVPTEAVDRLVQQILATGGSVIVNTAPMKVTMGDSYKVEQAGAVGPGAKASRMTFRQTREGHPADCQELAKELALLVDALREEAETPEHQEAIGMVMAAQKAVESGDGSKAVAYLKRAGGWVLGLGEKIGVAVAVRYMVG